MLSIFNNINEYKIVSFNDRLKVRILVFRGVYQ